MKNKLLHLLNLLAIAGLVALGTFVNEHINKINQVAKNRLYEQGFRVGEIHINQLDFIEVEEVIDSLDFENGDAILEVDLVNNQQNIKRNFWIESVSIKLVFPDIVKINIVEKKPEFVWLDRKKYFVLDAGGKILKEISKDGLGRFAGFVVVVGKGANLFTPNLSDFIKEDEEVYSFISLIKWVGGRRWDVKFVNDMVVKLPQQDPSKAWSKFLDLNKKLKFFNNKIKSIDLRVKDRLFIELDLDYPINRKIIEEIG